MMKKFTLFVFTMCAFLLGSSQYCFADPARHNLRITMKNVNKAVKDSTRQALQNTFRTKTRLNLRQQPSAKANIIETLDKGTQVIALDTSRDVWWKINSNNTTGWVHSGFLSQ